MDNTVAHEQLVNDLLVALTHLPDAMFYRNSSGVGRTKRGHLLRAGVKGGGDIMGCYQGRATAIEAKTGEGTQRKSQKNFQSAWERANGLYLIARDVDGTLAALQAGAANRGASS